MKRFLTLIALALFTGCASTDENIIDATHRAPTTSVDVFKDGKTPNRKYKEIAEFSYLGPREEEFKAQRRFVAQAKKIGGDAIILDVVLSGDKGGGSMYGYGVSTAWMFKCKAVVYEQ